MNRSTQEPGTSSGGTSTYMSTRSLRDPRVEPPRTACIVCELVRSQAHLFFMTEAPVTCPIRTGLAASVTNGASQIYSVWHLVEFSMLPPKSHASPGTLLSPPTSSTITSMPAPSHACTFVSLLKSPFPCFTLLLLSYFPHTSSSYCNLPLSIPSCLNRIVSLVTASSTTTYCSEQSASSTFPFSNKPPTIRTILVNRHHG